MASQKRAARAGRPGSELDLRAALDVAAAPLLLPPLWTGHDALEGALTEAERLQSDDPAVVAAVAQVWQAHDLLERAILKLHACLAPRELQRLMDGR